MPSENRFGLVRRFNGDGIDVSGEHSSVEGVAITSNCVQGILVSGSYNEVEGNSVNRFSPAPTCGCTGIFVEAGPNRILNNEVVGGGLFPITSSKVGFGIFVGQPGASSNNNLTEGNDVSGNPTVGIIIAGPFGVRPGSTGNTVRHNQLVGNIFAGDIIDFNDVPANNYDNNLCEVSNLSNICKLPNITGHRNGPVDR